jgi:hypothetical protein
MDRHTGRDHQRREGRALRSPLNHTDDQRHESRDTLPTSWENRHRPGGTRSSGVTSRGGSNPQQPPTNTDTVLHAGEPPLHLGHEIGSHMSMRPAEVANHHKPPPTCTGNSIRQPNLSPALSPGKVGPQHRRPTTSHRRPCHCLPGSRLRPRRSEKPTSNFSTPRLTARHRRPPHPAVHRRPQRRRRRRVVGRRCNEQRRKGASAAGRRPLAAEPPTWEAPAGQRSARRPPAGKHPEQAAPLPHHPRPVVAAAGLAPIRPPYEAAPLRDPRFGHGNVRSGRPTTR